jgi:hypothetical protein
LRIPALGTIYEDWFRPETYYREDTRELYLTLLPKIIQEAAEEITGAKGLKLERLDPSAPMLQELRPAKAK